MGFFQRNIRSIVYGGLDGIITTFAVISSVIGASLSVSIILILGFANLLADGFSMAAGAYLSEKAEREQKKQAAKAAKTAGWVTFLSFAFFGFLPLLPFVVGIFSDFIAQYVVVISVFTTFFTLMLLGIVKANIVNVSKLRSVIEICVIGGIASIIAYGIGFVVSFLI